jgi:hypothetical protein
VDLRDPDDMRRAAVHLADAPGKMTLATTIVGFGIIIAAGVIGWERYWKNRPVDPVVEQRYRPPRRSDLPLVAASTLQR